MDPANPTSGVFLLFIVLPAIVGAVIGMFTDRISAVRGIMIGGIAGGLVGYFAMILLVSP